MAGRLRIIEEISSPAQLCERSRHCLAVSWEGAPALQRLPGPTGGRGVGDSPEPWMLVVTRLKSRTSKRERWGHRRTGGRRPTAGAHSGCCQPTSGRYKSLRV